MMSWFYYVAGLIVRTLLYLLTRWQVRGRENIPSQGPLLVVANHLNLADPPLVSVSLGRKAIFMAKEELFRSRFSGYFVSRFGAFPVHRGQLDRQALRQAQRVLAQGLALVIFPEATRSNSAQLQPAFPGSGVIALRSGVPILPVGITGTEKLKGIAWLLARPQITVNIGAPFHLPSVGHKLTKAKLVELTSSIMGHIAELLPPEYRGNYDEPGKLDGIKS
ncbi:MAG: 1-acyl-sn-glycerol-3-phosphate acyltransferase [Chloroflexi bacterium]|nr:1-acyl-sn-glycerol-3-phosphate acyltransferase [Chloroflexota bacterium]MBI3931455.1 1-acyl-sn-glycerol-3-phosphate acyltransferase [Chloroflexota bacterium]